MASSALASTVIHRHVAAARRGDLARVVARMTSGWAVLGDPQILPGYCLLLPDPVVPHLNALGGAGRTAFLDDMARLGDAVLAVTSAERINYEILGNVEPALHAHVIPRFASEPDERRRAAVWLHDWNTAPPFDAEADAPLARAIADALMAGARRLQPGGAAVVDVPARLLETDRLVLRRLTTADAPFILGLLNEPSFLKFIGDKRVRTLDDARAYIEQGPMASYAQHGFGLYLTSLKQGSVPIGICGLLKRDVLDDVDIGFALMPAFWSQGYAGEAATAVLDYARNVLGLDRVVAVANPDNAASIRLLEKLGLRFSRMARLAAGEPELKLFSTGA